MRRVDFAKAEPVWNALKNIIAVWVFGSGREGILRHGGDIDIAVLFDNLPDLDELAELRASLQDVLEVEEIDILLLNSAGAISSFEAVSGKSLYCRDKGRRAEFVSLAARQYEDDMAFMARGMAIYFEGRQKRTGTEPVAGKGTFTGADLGDILK